MHALLQLARVIDWMSEKFGTLASWTVLVAALISAGSAFASYALSYGSNAWAEIQWYLFAYMVMVGAPVVLKRNEHVRVDLIYGKLKGNGPVYVDLFGLVVFLMPVMGLLFALSWPYFLNAVTSGEMSQNSGGMVRWPVLFAMPLGFALVMLQGVSEIIKRIAYLRGLYAMDTHYAKPLQ